MKRKIILQQIAQQVLTVRRPHPVRVAIDGIDAAGKTMLALELADLIRASGRHKRSGVIQASVDGFHRPRVDRYRRGQDSPEGYYFDSFDYPALLKILLQPLGPGGDRLYRTAIYDFHSDSPVKHPPAVADSDTILLFDGVFLLRPELFAEWDFSIFVHVDFEIAIARACQRDQTQFNDPRAIRAKYLQRYYPGQKLYLESVHPRQLASLVLDNNDLQNPKLVDDSLH